MTAFENIVIGKSSIPSLIITIVLMIAIPVVSLIYWRRKHRQQTNIGYLIAGIIGFMVSARVLELGVHYLCIINDNQISRFINSHTLAFVLYGIIMAGVFEECGRYIVMKFILRKNRTAENAVLYGIGHGGIEILAVLLPSMILYLVIAVSFSSGDVENALSVLKINEETASSALPSVLAAASFDWQLMAMNVIERILAMIAHIGLTIIVFYGICNKRICFLPMAIILHMLMDTFPAIYQRGLLPLWTVELWDAFWVSVIALIARRLYRNLKLKEQ